MKFKLGIFLSKCLLQSKLRVRVTLTQELLEFWSVLLKRSILIEICIMEFALIKLWPFIFPLVWSSFPEFNISINHSRPTNCCVKYWRSKGTHRSRVDTRISWLNKKRRTKIIANILMVVLNYECNLLLIKRLYRINSSVFETLNEY